MGLFRKRRPSKTASWLSRAMAGSAVPIRVAFTKDNPSDKKMLMIFMHDHEAESVNGNSPWFAPPWQEMSVDGENKWCLVVEADPPGKPKEIKPPSGGEEDEEGEDGDGSDGEEQEAKGQSKQTKKQEKKEDEKEKKELEKLKSELKKKKHNLFEKEPPKRVEQPKHMVPQTSKEPVLQGKDIAISFGMTKLCNCKSCRNKRGG